MHKLSHMLRKSDELAPLREEQLAMNCTWKISVDRLSSEALAVLQAASILGNAPIPEDLFKCILREVAHVGEKGLEEGYSRVVLNELAFGSSLLERTQIEGEDYFDMHRLV